MREPATRLDLRPSHRALETFGRRSLDAVLPEALQSAAFAKWKPRGTATLRRVGLSAWQQMTLNEYRSQVGFTTVLHAMTQLGLPRDALQTMERLTRDEVVHVELCRRMVTGLGGDDLIPGTPQWVSLLPELEPFEQVVEFIITSLCIGETLSCALLGAAGKVATDAMAKTVLTRMTADESIHGQSGFHFLAVLLQALPKRRWGWHERRASTAAELAFQVCLMPYDQAKHPFGALPSSRVGPILETTWKRLIGPGFERVGLRVRAPRS